MTNAKLFYGGTEIPISDLRFGPSAEPKAVDPFQIPELKPWRCEFNIEGKLSDELWKHIETAHRKLLEQIAEQETRAVLEWSAESGLTPERWLELFGVETTVEYGDDGKVRLVTRPVTRELSEGETMSTQENFDRIVNKLSGIPRDLGYLPDIVLAGNELQRFILILGSRFSADGLIVSVDLGPNGLTESKLAVTVQIETGHGLFETEYVVTRDAEAIAKSSQSSLPEDDPDIDTRHTGEPA